MKRLSIVSFVFLFLLAIVVVSSAECDPSIQLLNQDPYPAIPGEYVKLVFQVNGLSDPTCVDMSFRLLDKYPLSFDNNSDGLVSLKSGTFVRSYSSYALIPYKVRVDSGALDGENQIETELTKNTVPEFAILNTFDLTVEDTRADFEVYVEDFNPATKKINFEILNIAEANVEAVTVELLASNEIQINGAKVRIIGDLDSNEYTTAEFEVEPIETEVLLNVHYTDSAGFRRMTEEKVVFNPQDFLDKVEHQKSPSNWPWIILGVVIIVGVIWFFKKRKNKKN